MIRSMRFIVIPLLIMASCGDDTAVTPQDAKTEAMASDTRADRSDGPVSEKDSQADGPLANHDGPLSDSSLEETCQALAQQYTETLALARECSPELSVLQCTELIGDDLACPCTTHVNNQKTTEINQLKSLQSKFDTMGCVAFFACPAMPCPSPGEGACMPQLPSGGRCEDNVE